MPFDLDDLVALVRTIAREELLPRFTHTEARIKADGTVVTEADLVVQMRLAEALRERYPRFELLGEEMEETRQRALLAESTAGLWCLDPVDGTGNFAAGFPLFCISLGLLIGAEPELGVVYDPIRDECFTARRGHGAHLNGQPLRCRPTRIPLQRCLAVVDLKRLDPELATNLAAYPPYCSQRYLGSGALEWCWLAANRFHLYLHGKQKLWDFAAGALILAEAGGFSATLEGEPLFAGRGLARSAIAASDSRLFGAWQGIVAARMAAIRRDSSTPDRNPL